MIKGFASHQRDADKITKLEVSSLISYNRFRYLSFPALTEVVLDAHYLPNYRPKVGTVRISSYLQPTLRKLHLRELFVLTIDAMDLICLRCPLLEDLELACQLAFNNPDEYLLHAPFSFPKLRRLVYKWDSIISPPLMQRLSEQLPLLEYLDIGHGDLDMWGGDSGPVFPELRTLILQLWPRPSVPDLYVISLAQSVFDTDEGQ
jgi:hypothetical protein